MKNQEPVTIRPSMRQNDRLSKQIQGRASPAYNSGKNSHSPGLWKKYVATESHLPIQHRRENLNNPNVQSWNDASDRQSKPNPMSGTYHDNYNAQNSKMQQQRRRKQEMIKRVQDIEKRVLPILKSQRNADQIDENYGWDNKMQQRLLKLQTNIDNIQKQMQIKIQKRLIQVERQWNQKIEMLISHYVNEKKGNSGEDRNKNINGARYKKQNHDNYQQSQEYPHHHYESSQKTNKSIRNNNVQIQNDQSNEIVQGYFTRRQLEGQSNTHRKNDNDNISRNQNGNQQKHTLSNKNRTNSRN